MFWRFEYIIYVYIEGFENYFLFIEGFESLSILFMYIKFFKIVLRYFNIAILFVAILFTTTLWIFFAILCWRYLFSESLRICLEKLFLCYLADRVVWSTLRNTGLSYCAALTTTTHCSIPRVGAMVTYCFALFISSDFILCIESLHVQMRFATCRCTITSTCASSRATSAVSPLSRCRQSTIHSFPYSELYCFLLFKLNILSRFSNSPPPPLLYNFCVLIILSFMALFKMTFWESLDNLAIAS